MRTKSLKRPKVNVITLGCSKNIYDSEVLMRQLRANAFEVVHEENQSDASVVIINTCGFIENAKEESINTILQFADAKEQGLVDKVLVTGCLSERYKPDLEKEISNVDAYFGTRDLPQLLKTLNADYKKELVGERLLTTPQHYAYFKIAEGCDRPCSFCAIPLMRGKHRSTPMEELVEQARALAAKGVKELILIAQDLTFYGLDLYKDRKLAELMARLSDVDGIEWIRLHYAYPSGFPLDAIDEMARNPKICKYLDMPLQHISDPMLKAMRRGITKQKTIDLVEEIRDRVPEIALRTTLMTGFPGETEQDHREMVDWVKQMHFERLGVFTYSHEENTHAYTMEDNVAEEVKEQRAHAVMDVQREISEELNAAKIGQTMRILVDRAEGDYFYGRTEFDSPEVDNEVLVNKSHFLRLGDFVNVKITDCTEYDLIAEPVKH